MVYISLTIVALILGTIALRGVVAFVTWLLAGRALWLLPNMLSEVRRRLRLLGCKWRSLKPYSLDLIPACSRRCVHSPRTGNFRVLQSQGLLLSAHHNASVLSEVCHDRRTVLRPYWLVLQPYEPGCQWHRPISQQSSKMTVCIHRVAQPANRGFLDEMETEPLPRHQPLDESDGRLWGCGAHVWAYKAAEWGFEAYTV